MHRILAMAGFEREFAKGDHWKYSHPDYAGLLIIDPRNPLLPAYVSRATKAILEVLDQ